MKKRILTVAILVLVLFFGYGLFFEVQYMFRANADRKKWEALDAETVEAVQMRWNRYEYSFTEDELAEFIKLFREIKLGEVTREQEVLVGDGCGVISEIQIQTKQGEFIYMETPAPYGRPVAVINGIGYKSDSDALNPMAEFLHQIENREFITANNQMPVSAWFPFKELKDQRAESITLKQGNKHYHLTQQEIAEFCEEFWNLAAYEKIETYRSLKDIQDVFETDLVITKEDGEAITVRLNYKVMIINHESYLIKIQASNDLYSYVEQQMENIK